MDYSLLLFVENRTAETSVDPESTHMFQNERAIYHVAVIDYLQAWNFNKKGERWLKTVVKKQDGAMLSAIEPNEYSLRFVSFLTSHVFN